MKKSLSFILILLLIVSCVLSACGGGAGEPATDPANPYVDEGDTDADTYEEPTTHVGALDIDTELNSDLLRYDFYDAEKDSDLPVYEGYGMDAADENSPVADITIRVSNSDDEKSFAFVLRSVVLSAYANGTDNKPMVWQHARYGNKTLLSVSGYAGEDVAYYFYDVSTGEFSMFGLMDTMRFLGNYLLMRPSANEERTPPMDVYNWQGEKVYTYESVLDLDRYHGDLYLIAGEPLQLIRVKEDVFYDQLTGFAGETLCGLGDYTGMFGIYRSGVISLKRKDGADFRVCTLEEAPQVLSALAEAPAEGHEPITEACGAFEVTLPGFWSGLYECDRSESGLSFAMKREGADPALLFSLEALSGTQALNRLGGSVFLCRYLRQDETLYITLTTAGSLVEDGDNADLYAALLDSVDGVAASLRPLGGAKLQDFDYKSTLSRYVGENEAGESYTLTLTDIERNVLLGELEFHASNGMIARAEAYIVMFGNVGFFVWNTFDDNGSGSFQLKDGGVVIDLDGPEDSWTNTEELTLQKQSK